MLPLGFASTKSDVLLKYLEISKPIFISIAGTRLLGPMMVMNNKGILVSSIASDDEINIIKNQSKLNVERLRSKYTAIGNLIAANDYGAIVSPLCSDVIKQVSDVLDVQAISIGVSDLSQTGSIVVITNNGGVIHPGATETEIKTISDILNVNLEPVTINGGIPYLASGIIANSKSVIVGNLTTGPELIMLSRAFNL